MRTSHQLPADVVVSLWHTELPSQFERDRTGRHPPAAKQSTVFTVLFRPTLVEGATCCYYHCLTRWILSQLLFTAFSNRQDAVDLAREAGERLHGEGIDSNLLLLDTTDTPSMDETTLVISLGGDGTFLKSARL